MFRSPDLAGGIATLARRLLYAWIRTRVVRANPSGPALDAGKPVCYVLQDRRLSNVLVLTEELRRANLPGQRFFCLARTRGLAGRARECHRHSDVQRQLVCSVIADPDFDVQIVPVTILWGRAPHHQESVLKALFSETWGPTGHLRQLFAILFHGRQTLVHFAASVSLRELLAGEADEARALRKLARVLRVHFRRQRELAIGPDLSHRNTQIARLLAAPAVRRAIAAEAAAHGISSGEAHERARRFALEIPSDYSYGVARAFEIFLDWLWMRLYDGIDVRNIEALDAIPAGSGIVYLPCHRSHIDYLLLSFIIYRHGMTPPHIAAGINLNLPLVGPLLRRGGAFFLRRSFKGEPLYAAVFHEYLHLMISRGFPIEYFIEGTRSRTGRMLPPRAGILGMTVRSFLRDHGRPLVFVPVYVGYEKLIEGRSYVNELSGQPKRKESIWSLLGTVRDLKHHFGKVHVKFGRPLDLAEFLDGERPDWRSESDEALWSREATRLLAEELARRINEAAVMTPVSLMALVMLAAPGHAADEATVRRMIGHYRALLASQPGDQPPDAIIEHACRLGSIERIGRLLRVPESEAALLAYFRENVLHLVALPALVACLLTESPRLGLERVTAAVRRLLSLARDELFMRCSQEDVPAALATTLAALAARGLVLREADELAAPAEGSREREELAMLGEAMRAALGRHLLVVALAPDSGIGDPSSRSHSASPRG